MLGTRPRGRTIALTLSALALAAAAPPGSADDSVSFASAPGYPRSSDTPAIPMEVPADGWGDPNTSAAGTQYDTNWVLAAIPGEDDSVWLRVRKACVLGGGRVVDADPDASTAYRKEGWGEDRLTISVTAEPDDRCVILVTNTIRISGAWVLLGNGRNTAVLRAQALDIYDRVHEVQRTLVVDPTVVETKTDAANAGTAQTSDTSSTANVDDIAVKVGHSGSVEVGAALHDVRNATTTDSVKGDISLEFPVERRFEGTECTVRIASAELISLTAQAITDEETSTTVDYWDTVNVVDAAYVIDPWGGPGTPGGEDPPPPTTPGGGGPSTGPTTPSGGDGSSTPTTPSTPDDPTEPKEPDEPNEPLHTPPSGDDEGTMPAPDGSGTAPAPGTLSGSGTDTGGTLSR